MFIHEEKTFIIAFKNLSLGRYLNYRRLQVIGKVKKYLNWLRCLSLFGPFQRNHRNVQYFIE